MHILLSIADDFPVKLDWESTCAQTVELAVIWNAMMVMEHNLRFFRNISYQGAVSIRKTVLPGVAIPMLKIRRPNGHLIFNMEITIRR